MIMSLCFLSHQDEQLRQAVAVHGNCWAVVAASITATTVSGQQCQLRWSAHVNPEIACLKKGNWEKEEVIVLNKSLLLPSYFYIAHKVLVYFELC